MSSSPDTDPHHDQAAPDQNAALLRIVAGLHAGASRPLSRREMVLVGSGDDCDVVLADAGVAAHHALVNVVDGRFHLRALDAPLELPGRTLHPGDPVEVSQVQRIGIGEAAIAFGRADAPEWVALAPDFGVEPQPRRRPAFTSRLPMIAGVAVLALAGLAIFAAWMPAAPPPVDVEHRLRELAREHRVSDVSITRDVNGRAVLSGTVDDGATADRLDARIASEALPASVALRSGQDLAVDVAEVMRTGGYSVEAEYLGDNNVRVTGRLGGDGEAVREFIRSRAMVETGVNMVEPVDLDEAVADASADAGAIPQTQAHIVSVVRGDAPYVETADGERYQVGDAIPGWGELISIGAHAHVLRPDGALAKLKPSPAPPPVEDAPDAAASAPPAGGAQPGAANAGPVRRVQQPETGAGLSAGALDSDTP
ncbi:FHA domain-containing protein [Luteimonas kalidii]|uniref:FHA domain-containing protein n=1 Tax=Luteimonas kalidii TaxID=3042025 RepID=A0ABT6JUU4_9GAMM|nr:FHA domain-containing protein [Luteimonas kalidii]MDH5834461.1 FHA domain-containing protein [Luteimonas kalidii]